MSGLASSAGGARRVDAYLESDPDPEFDLPYNRPLEAGDIESFGWSLAHAGAHATAQLIAVDDWRTYRAASRTALPAFARYGIQRFDRHTHLDYPVDRRGVLFSGATRDVVAGGLTRPPPPGSTRAARGSTTAATASWATSRTGVTSRRCGCGAGHAAWPWTATSRCGHLARAPPLRALRARSRQLARGMRGPRRRPGLGPNARLAGLAAGQPDLRCRAHPQRVFPRVRISRRRSQAVRSHAISLLPIRVPGGAVTDFRLWGSYAPRAWDTSCWVADPAPAERALGWQAGTELRAGLEATIAWFREEGLKTGRNGVAV